MADPEHIVLKTPAGELGRVVDVTVATDHGAITLPKAYTYFDYDLKLTEGGTTISYTLEQIAAMPAATGFWGAINDMPYNTDQYKGVPLLALVRAVGGWAGGQDITVQSADGFVSTYTSAMLRQMADGTYPMWNVNGTQIITNDRFAQPLVAYEMDTTGDGSHWEKFPAGKGPFRIVMAAKEADRLSNGPPNPFLATDVEVKTGTAPSSDSTSTSVPTTTTAATASTGGGALALTSLNIATGPRCGYQNVTLTGSGFTGVTGVTFGTVKAAGFTVAGPSQIVVKTPRGDLGRTVDITVTTDHGNATLPKAFTYFDYDLKVVKGDKTATYTVDQLEAMDAATGFWGAHKGETPFAVDQFKGVPLLRLLDAVGGWTKGESISITSADAFTTAYTSDMLEQMSAGTYPMWNVNGTEIITNDRVAQPIVSYAMDDKGDNSGWEPIEAGLGPLRIVLITKQSDRVNQGKFNPFLPVTVEVTTP